MSSYTPTTSVPNFASFAWSTPLAPTPRLASPISATTTTIVITSAPLDHTGAAISLAFIMGIRNVTGYVESVYVPAGGVTLNTDGSATLTGCVRGIYLEGLDFTTSNASLAAEADESSTVFCNISGIIQAINQSALSAQIGANIKFNGRPLWMGSGVNSCPVFADATARNAAITVPLNGDQCYLTSPGLFYDYTAGSWVARASGGTFPNGSTTVAGKFQAATVADQIAHTSAGSTGALLVPQVGNMVTTSAGSGDAGKLNILNASGKNDLTTMPLGTKGDLLTYSTTPAVLGIGSNGTVLTADSTQTDGMAWVSTAPTNGVATRSMDTASGTQTIAHGLGRVPNSVNIYSVGWQGASGFSTSTGSYDASGQNLVYLIGGSTGAGGGNKTSSAVYYEVYNDGTKYQTGVVSVDATNITITWTKTSTPGAVTLYMLWKAL